MAVMASLQGGCDVNTYVVALAGLAMAVMSCAPALAGEREAVMEQGGVAAYSEDPAGEEASMKCPNCGERIVLGRHGHTGPATVCCPYCGKQICPAGEAEKAFSAGADAGFFSRYVSRGVVTTDGPVFQPDAWLSYNGLTFSVWGNMDLTDTNGNRGEFNELDFALSYSREWGKLDFSAGGVYYDFPNTDAADTAEVYASAGYDILLHPVIAVYYDFLEVDGFYASAGISHCIELPLGVDSVTASLDLSAQAGWGSRNFNQFNLGTERGAFTDLVVTAGLPVSLGKRFTITPSVGYSTVLDRGVREQNELDDNIVWGLTAQACF